MSTTPPLLKTQGLEAALTRLQKLIELIKSRQVEEKIVGLPILPKYRAAMLFTIQKVINQVPVPINLLVYYIASLTELPLVKELAAASEDHLHVQPRP